MILSNIFKLATVFPEQYLASIQKEAAPTHYGFNEVKTHLYENSKKYKELKDFMLGSPSIALSSPEEVRKMGKEFKEEAEELVKDLNLIKGEKPMDAARSLMEDLFRLANNKAKKLQESEAAKSNLEEEAKKIFKESQLRMNAGLKNYFLDKAHAFKKAGVNEYSDYLWKLADKF